MTNTYRNRVTGEETTDGNVLLEWMFRGEEFDLVATDGTAVVGFTKKM